MLKSIKALIRDEEGATMVEYGLMLALIAVVAMVAVELVGGSTKAKFEEVDTKLQ